MRSGALAAPGAGLARGPRRAGLFLPLIGLDDRTAVALCERAPGAEGPDPDLAALARHAAVEGATPERLTLRAEPAAGRGLSPGGVWVMRWFDVAVADADAFLEFSTGAWPDFERRFEARVLGMFDAPPAGGRVRFRLFTWYSGHLAWEVSRDPTSQAAALFARRAEITERTGAASLRRLEA